LELVVLKAAAQQLQGAMLLGVEGGYQAQVLLLSVELDQQDPLGGLVALHPPRI
jgi:hypothetical protein